MESQRTRISVVCPCYNEEDVVWSFYHELREVLAGIPDVLFSIVFVDDGSRDATLAQLNEIAQADPIVSVYSLSRNFGHQVALTAGLDRADGDAVIMMDSDLQHPPVLIPKMIEAWRAGFDIVSMVRMQTEGASWFKAFSADGFYWLFNRLSETRLEAGAADFCLLSKRAYSALNAMPERHRFLRGMISWMGFNRCLIEYRANKRSQGTSKYSLVRMLRFASDAVFSFSSRPVRYATRMGLTLSALGLCYLAYVLFNAVFMGDLAQGWASLISVVLILGGAQLVFLGLLGEYVARIFDESKQRPLYLLKQRPEEEPFGVVEGGRPAAFHLEKD